MDETGGIAEKSGNGAPLVKLVCGLMYPRGDPELRDWSKTRLAESFGRIERESESFDFSFTDYYRDISPDLARCFFTFAGLRHPALVEWKRTAISLEAESGRSPSGGGRRVNIDPGYIDGARLALASTKDNAHRIYIDCGIFAEVTLCRRKSGWDYFSYTFPDFKSGVYDEFLELARLDWRREMKERRSPEARKIREILGNDR
jgi:hypothetical protein